MRAWFHTRSVDDVRPGDHAWLPYSGAEERDQVVGPFVRDALAFNEKVVYVTETPAHRLPGIGPRTLPSLGRLTENGQLRVLSRAEACLDGSGDFDPGRLGRTIEREVEHGFASGFRAVRVTTDYSWLLNGAADLRGLLGCENEVGNTVSPSTMAVAICQIDRRVCPPEGLAGLADEHEVRVEVNPEYDDGTLKLVRTFAPRGLRVEGELDAVRHAAFTEHLGRALAGRRGLHLDCSRLIFLDLGALNLLARQAATLRPGDALILDDLPQNVENVIEMVGWQRLPGLVRGTVRSDGGLL